MFWRTFILVALCVINVVLFYRMIWSPTGLIAYWNLKEQYAALENRIEELDNVNLALSREIRLLQSDDKYMEKMIRQRLHYVRDNEIFYLFTEAQGTPRSGVGANEGKN